MPARVTIPKTHAQQVLPGEVALKNIAVEREKDRADKAESEAKQASEDKRPEKSAALEGRANARMRPTSRFQAVQSERFALRINGGTWVGCAA